MFFSVFRGVSWLHGKEDWDLMEIDASLKGPNGKGQVI